jgi:hypothetical protein
VEFDLAQFLVVAEGAGQTDGPRHCKVPGEIKQEAVSLMFMQSGKIKEGATEKYNDKYGYWWTAHNTMLAFLKIWERQMKYNEVVQDFLLPMLKQRRITVQNTGGFIAEG